MLHTTPVLFHQDRTCHLLIQRSSKLTEHTGLEGYTSGRISMNCPITLSQSRKNLPTSNFRFKRWYLRRKRPGLNHGTMVISESWRSSTLSQNDEDQSWNSCSKNAKNLSQPDTSPQLKSVRKVIKYLVENSITLLSHRWTNNIFQLWNFVIDVMRIWLKDPLTVWAPEEFWSSHPPLKMKLCFPIKVSRCVVHWIGLWRHVVPMTVLW